MDFQRVYKSGQRIRGKNYSLIFAANDFNGNRLGISVHGYRGAVKRNRVKRIIREFYRLNRSQILSSIDLVFTVRKGFTFVSPAEIEVEIMPRLEKAGIKAA